MKKGSTQIVNGALILGWGLAIGAGVLVWKNSQEEEVENEAVVQPEDPSVFDPRFELLANQVEELEKEPAFEAAMISLCLLDSTGRPIVRHNDTRSIIPASALKTVTAATALELYGPDFRFKTLLQGTAPFEPGQEVYTGDLVILGGGDPSLTKEDLVALAKWVAEKGIKKIEGRVIGDGQVFPELIAAKAWDWGDVGNRYGAAVSGLNIDQNAFTAQFRPGAKVGDPATLAQIYPEVPGVELINLMLTCEQSRDYADRPYVYGGPYSKTLTFRGAIRLGLGEETVDGSVPDPSLATAYRFNQALTGLGISVTGEATTTRRLSIAGEGPPQNLEPGTDHLSAPLIDLLKPLHMQSINLYAEAIFRLLALKRADRNARKVIEEHWATRGITFVGLRLEDGSGLARADLIRPVDLAAVNYAVRQGVHGDAFVGTLNSPYERKVQWKVGYMSRVRTHVGFVGGYTFVLAFNNHDATIAQVTKARDQLMKVLISCTER